MSKFIYTLYKTVNKITDQFYIGIHKINTEKYPDYNDGYLGSGKRLKRVVKKYGKESFKRTILVISDDPKYIASLEEQLVNQETLNDPLCLNIALGGSGSVKGHVLSEETKMKLSEVGKEKRLSKETKKKISESAKGRVFSYETRKKLSEANKGKIVSDETRKN
jgi:hypothetical protein